LLAKDAELNAARAETRAVQAQLTVSEAEVKTLKKDLEERMLLKQSLDAALSREAKLKLKVQESKDLARVSVSDRLAAAEEKVDKHSEQMTCGICMGAEKCVMMIPCGHLVSCTSCWECLPVDSKKKCSMCRTPVTTSQRMFI